MWPQNRVLACGRKETRWGSCPIPASLRPVRPVHRPWRVSLRAQGCGRHVASERRVAVRTQGNQPEGFVPPSRLPCVPSALCIGPWRFPCARKGAAVIWPLGRVLACGRKETSWGFPAAVRDWCCCLRPGLGGFPCARKEAAVIWPLGRALSCGRKETRLGPVLNRLLSCGRKETRLPASLRPGLLRPRSGRPQVRGLRAPSARPSAPATPGSCPSPSSPSRPGPRGRDRGRPRPESA